MISPSRQYPSTRSTSNRTGGMGFLFVLTGAKGCGALIAAEHVVTLRLAGLRAGLFCLPLIIGESIVKNHRGIYRNGRSFELVH